VRLGSLGSAYSDLGETRRAIEFYEQALEIARDIGARRGESIDLENLGYALMDLQRLEEAEASFEKALQIADEIGFVLTQCYGQTLLAQARLYAGNLSGARAAIEAAGQYDDPQNNHNVAALRGVIALRQGQGEAAAQAFARRYSFSDRVRYYWGVPAVRESLARLMRNLKRVPLPLPLVSQFFPRGYRKIREGEMPLTAEALLHSRIEAVLEDYRFATGG
jgi:tetratricopeptide (TPR) repeat protein